MENNTEENPVLKHAEWIIPLIVFGGLYLFGQVFLVILVSIVLLFFMIGEATMSEETRQRRLKSWGKTSILSVIFKLITFQKPLDEKDEPRKSRLFIGFLMIGLILGIAYIYLDYFLI
jgi:hypothetical protein